MKCTREFDMYSLAKMTRASLALCLLLAGCATPTAPALKPERAAFGARPGDPGGAHPWWDGIYADSVSGSWMVLDHGHNQALLVSIMGDTARFEPMPHERYVSAVAGANDMCALYYPEAHAFYVSLHYTNPESEVETYTSLRLERQ